jgi:ketosteroid isomerase-like protein
MFRPAVVSLALALWSVACAPPSSSSSADVRAAIAQNWSGFKQAWLAGNVGQASSAFFTGDAINTVPGIPDSKGLDAIKTDFGNILKSNKVLTIDQQTEEVDVDGSLAYERGTFMQMLQPAEGATQRQQSRYLAIWKRQPDGSWKCHRFFINNAPTSS